MPGVLLYHRLNATPSDPWALNVAPSRFAEHLEVLRARFEPIPLSDLARNMVEGLLSAKQVAVTFDDGYADSLYEAIPVLERLEARATFFIPTGHIGSSREFWWDELDSVLLQPGVLPRRLALDLGHERFAWDLEEAARYSTCDARRQAEWVAWEAPPTSRHALYLALWRRCRSLAESARVELLRQLHEWAGLRPRLRPTHRVLDATELSRLHCSPSADVGAHTVSHPTLAALALSDQRIEIENGKIDLEHAAGRAVDAFAYPFGKRSDYTQETIGVVRSAGFLCACTNEAGAVTSSTPMFELPRLFVQDMTGRDFEHWLSNRLA